MLASTPIHFTMYRHVSLFLAACSSAKQLLEAARFERQKREQARLREQAAIRIQAFWRGTRRIRVARVRFRLDLDQALSAAAGGNRAGLASHHQAVRIFLFLANTHTARCSSLRRAAPASHAPAASDDMTDLLSRFAASKISGRGDARMSRVDVELLDSLLKHLTPFLKSAGSSIFHTGFSFFIEAMC
jgi:hypothetical protein